MKGFIELHDVNDSPVFLRAEAIALVRPSSEHERNAFDIRAIVEVEGHTLLVKEWPAKVISLVAREAPKDVA